ncbi:MAG: hypothetical protein JJU28_20310 [Cyclobacteriaceae bacterium]|nr:hypothetical protein [Cyclobacteriaceae bacterium]
MNSKSMNFRVHHFRVENPMNPVFLFQIALVLLTLGLSFQSMSGTNIGLFLSENTRLNLDTVLLIERTASYLLFFAAVLMFIYPNRPLALSIFFYMLFLAYTGFQLRSGPFSHLIFFTSAMRTGTPLIVFLLMTYPRLLENNVYIKRLLIFTCLISAATFMAHGWEAIHHYPKFIKLISGSFVNLFHLALPETAIIGALSIIGTVDILTGLGIVIYPTRYLAAWMAFWGFITAMSRITESGLGAFSEVLVRAPHFILPLAIISLLLRKSSGESKALTSS